MNWTGHTGKSFFDVWTTVHIAFWYYVGSVLWSFKVDRIKATISCVLFALLWEFFERIGEKRWPHLWLSPESWHNSYVSDILTVFVGVFSVWWLLDNWRSP